MRSVLYSCGNCGVVVAGGARPPVASCPACGAERDSYRGPDLWSRVGADPDDRAPGGGA
jgi:predicted  nucleic acid-binding Zn-ribbon protein